MTSIKLPPPPRPAKRGSKVGWRVVGGEVPPEVAEEFEQIALRNGVSRSHLAGEILSSYVAEQSERAA